MRAEELEQDGKSIETLPQPTEASTHVLAERAGPDSFGQRLRAAREAKGLTRSDVAQRLRLPLRLIARLEDDDYSGIDQGVYLRGYLGSYARLVDVPTVAADTVAATHMRAAPLVATGQVSRSRYLFDRYSVSATYVILTALIVLPAVWLATHGGLEQNLVHTMPLDTPATTIPVPASTANGSVASADAHDAGTSVDAPADGAPSTANAADATATAAVEPPKQEQLVVASMAPFSAPAPAATEPPPAAHAATGSHSLALKLKAASWVEIVGADGNKLEYGILPAGVEKTYSSDGPLSVRIGNADGAEVELDGKTLDLAPYRHANVARLRVFGADGAVAQPAEF